MSKITVCLLALVCLSVSWAGAADYAPGRLILKMEPEAASGWLEARTTGYADLDDCLRELQVVRTRRLAKSREDGINQALRRRFGVSGLVALQYASDMDPQVVAARLASLPGVRYVHPDYYVELLEVPDDPFFPEQYAMPLMQMPEAWDVEKGSEAVVIAISDTGTDWNHPDLADNIYINAAEDANGNGVFDNFPFSEGGDLDEFDADGNGYVDDVIGWDFITGEYPEEGEDGYPPDPDPMDFGGHGTNTAGIAGAVTDNGLMVAGTAWHCKIMPLKILYSATQGSGGISSDMVESFYYAADNNVDVLSMSWRSPNSEAFQEAAVYAHAAGVFLAASAGNDNSDNWQTPSAYPEILSVAATQRGDLKADFSNYGAWVGIAAPGVDIYTTAYDDTSESSFGGTSASCPYVAGVAGLVLSRFPALTNTEVYYRLTGTADQIDLVNPLHRGKLGSGRVNGYRALTEDPHPTLRLVEITVDDSVSGNGDGLLGPGETATLGFKIRNFWQATTGVTGYLSTEDPQVSVDSTAAILFGPLETDSTAVSTPGAEVVVSMDADIGYHVDFVLTLETDEGYVEIQPFGVPMAQQVFADVAASLGFETSGRTHTVAFADLDGDGDLDFYRASWSYDHGLYRNDGTALVDVIGEWGLPMTGKGQGASWGDYDNDGDPDLLHGTLSGIALFRNDGPATGFTEVTETAGLIGDALKNFTPIWGDYDDDGWLDIYVAHQEQDNLLFHNNGDGTFTELSEAAGVHSAYGSYAASWADFDRDGDLDLFVANSSQSYGGEPNELFVNQGDGTFIDQALILGLAEEALVSTGGVWGDYDGDGWLDLYVTNIGPSFNGGEPNKLFRNIRGRGFVREVYAGVEDIRSSAAAAWGDFDSDGRLDLYVCNSQRNALYRNLGGGVFGEATESATIVDWGWTAAWMDLDGDGDEDLYVGKGGADQILSNLTNPESILQVSLTGGQGAWAGPLDATRTRVTLSGTAGAITRVVGEGCGIGQSSPILTLPLEPVGSDPVLTMEWPGGTMQQQAMEGAGAIAITESRPGTDLGLRAVALPLNAGPQWAVVPGVVMVQDNGQTPFTNGQLIMEVRTLEGSPVFADSLEIAGGDHMVAEFPVVPVPPEGETFLITFTGVTSNDGLGWNDALTQILRSGPAVHDFELPPVYWEMTSGWRWATSASAHPAGSGRGYLFLGPGQAGVFTAHMPPVSFDGDYWVDLRFSALYSLGQDTVWVNVESNGQVVASKAIDGSQDQYAWDALRFNTAVCSGMIHITWSCTRSDSTTGDWFFCVDDVEPVVVAGGEETMPKPQAMTIEGPWPNPSSAALSWRLYMPEKAVVHFDIYDLGGRCVYQELLGVLPAGLHLVAVTPDALTSGVYLARFRTSAHTRSRRFVKLR